MASQPFEEPSGRETRLLAIVIVVSIAVLLLLARFRFPSARLADVTPAQGPLVGLAARAPFDEMAMAMQSLVDRVSPVMAIVQIAPIAGGNEPGRRSTREGRGR